MGEHHAGKAALAQAGPEGGPSPSSIRLPHSIGVPHRNPLTPLINALVAEAKLLAPVLGGPTPLNAGAAVKRGKIKNPG
jgi:hypothetical protein